MRGQLSEIQRLRQSNSRLRNENKKLRARVLALETENKELRATIEDLKLQIEELRRMIFGNGSKGGKNSENKLINQFHKKSSGEKPALSYRRPVPSKETITDEEYYPLNQCPDCGGNLTALKKIERYIEDILPLSEWRKVLKKVEKEVINTGYCKCCKKRVCAKPISPQMVILGENIRQFVSYATVILRLSYEQIKDFLESTSQIRISDGEISNILEKESKRLMPVLERLKANIRGKPIAHYDETGWKVQQMSQGNHAWVMTSADSTDAIFLLGRSRGKGNIELLRGENNNKQIGISDDYGAYKNIFSKHALCWAHPHRKLRDLKNSGGLSIEKKNHCEETYKNFAKLYDDIQTSIGGKDKNKISISIKNKFKERFDEIIKENPLDPLKLRRIKTRLKEQKECYFVCLEEKGIPMDNNKAERALRHLVLKRKSSYGSKTQAGADKMSILYSVLLSAWWRAKTTFFQEYNQLFSTI